jgi:Tfp pilus assembly protein PilF
VRESPKNADALGSYASFLHGVHNNAKDAQKYYQMAVKADDTHTNNLCNYGLFLSEEMGAFADAERMYK